jgi:hypothetical protein
VGLERACGARGGCAVEGAAIESARAPLARARAARRSSFPGHVSKCGRQVTVNPVILTVCAAQNAAPAGQVGRTAPLPAPVCSCCAAQRSDFAGHAVSRGERASTRREESTQRGALQAGHTLRWALPDCCPDFRHDCAGLHALLGTRRTTDMLGVSGRGGWQPALGRQAARRRPAPSAAACAPHVGGGVSWEVAPYRKAASAVPCTSCALGSTAFDHT